MARAFALSILVVLHIACGGGSRNVGSTGSDTSTKTVEPKPKSDNATAVLHLALEMETRDSTPPTTQIDLVETNETGANTRHNLGVFDGDCRDATLDVRNTEPDVFLAFHCTPSEGQRGVLVHIMHRHGQLVLLRAWLGTSKPTFDEFDQIGDVPPFPTGVPLRTDFDKK